MMKVLKVILYFFFLPFILPYIIIKAIVKKLFQNYDARNINLKYGVRNTKVKKSVVIPNKKVNLKAKKWRNICKKEFVAIDIETTGLDSKKDRIVEVAAVKYRDLVEVENFTTLINPGIHIPKEITEINGIDNKMVKGAPAIREILPKLIEFIGESVIVAHNAKFDLGFLNHNASYFGYKLDNPYIDTLSLCRNIFPEFFNYKLGTIAKNLGIGLNNAHRALADTRAVGQILIECINRLDELDEQKLKEKQA